MKSLFNFKIQTLSKKKFKNGKFKKNWILSFRDDSATLMNNIILIDVVHFLFKFKENYRYYCCFEDIQLITLIKHQNFSNSNGYIWEFCINEQKEIYSITKIVDSIFDLLNCAILLMLINQRT